MIFYITEETKREVEDMILQLEQLKESTSDTLIYNDTVSKQNVYKDILFKSFVLPQYKSWDDVEFYPPDNESQYEKTIRDFYGVIIKE